MPPFSHTKKIKIATRVFLQFQFSRYFKVYFKLPFPQRTKVLLDLLVGDDCPESPDLSAVLQQLSAQVEGNVLRVDDALDEPHPLGHDLLSLALDQHLPAVQGNADAAVFARLEKT